MGGLGSAAGTPTAAAASASASVRMAGAPAPATAAPGSSRRAATKPLTVSAALLSSASGLLHTTAIPHAASPPLPPHAHLSLHPAANGTGSTAAATPTLGAAGAGSKAAQQPSGTAQKRKAAMAQLASPVQLHPSARVRGGSASPSSATAAAAAAGPSAFGPAGAAADVGSDAPLTATGLQLERERVVQR